mmetsp:Transcript_13165/g.17230  ORF Transcript_13165/g.17230 Transcript_13165/m.17230 type:complete len:187 (-) Transcript_13165:126-686(-)|eukprot:CAMPEP_0198155396 /NCGR_PEP_ID=MMETSP1443-20131203/69108_1 /TAXON_ID=186043 /ORGANISM="Entomoneis sp., Strain CCMP2396" /LENGTH=186 /DNA_ID=CAMNT_0043822143 /DNA_START=109 /DNA_END=669 /DNA_ORIENTATION=+
MLSRISYSVGRASARSVPSFTRCMGTTVRDAATADDALKFSGYADIDFTVKEDAPVYDAVQKFAAYNIGCLVMTDEAGNMTGIVSERDYISKIALLGRTSKDTPVKEIATRGSNIVTAVADESVDSCMQKMMSKGIRHLPIVDADKAVIGMISIKDLVATVVKEKEATIKVLSDFALGKGGHFGSE